MQVNVIIFVFKLIFQLNRKTYTNSCNTIFIFVSILKNKIEQNLFNKIILFQFISTKKKIIFLCSNNFLKYQRGIKTTYLNNIYPSRNTLVTSNNFVQFTSLINFFRSFENIQHGNKRGCKKLISQGVENCIKACNSHFCYAVNILSCVTRYYSLQRSIRSQNFLVYTLLVFFFLFSNKKYITMSFSSLTFNCQCHCTLF